LIIGLTAVVDKIACEKKTMNAPYMVVERIGIGEREERWQPNPHSRWRKHDTLVFAVEAYGWTNRLE